MAKFFGKIGFVETKETVPGVWDEVITEHSYSGDVLRNARRLQADDKVNSDVNINNEISILADPYANQHIYTMRYVEFQGARWKISNVDVRYPRLVLTIGGLYTNGQQT